MNYGILPASLLCLLLANPLWGQLSRDARFELLRTVTAEQAAARVALPFGADGVELSESGQINNTKLQKDMQKNGQSIEAGKIVTITELVFEDNKIEVELDGGGKNKKGILDRIQVGVGMGNRTTPVGRDDQTEKAKGSKIVLRFAKKVPPDLTPEQLRQLLNPILDFSKRDALTNTLAALPPEFQEAVKAKEARIGMDRNTVVMAIGRPDKRVRETVQGVYTEDWIYYGRGNRVTFVQFQDDVVVRIREYGNPSGSDKASR